MEISVLLPYRNAAATLEEALESTLADLGPRDELVTIDDGSTDDGPRVVASRSRRDGRIVTASARGNGIAEALVVGLALARHGLVARMDGDDVTLRGRFAAGRAALEDDPTLAAVGTRVEAFPAPTPGMDRYLAWQNALVTPEDHAREIFVESPLCNPSVLMRRDALAKVGAYRDAPWPEDWDLFLRLDAAGYGLAKVPRVLVRWRRHGDANTHRDPRCAPERLRAARAHFLAPRLLARSAPFAVWGAGKTGRRLARALAAEGARAAFFADIDPRKVGRCAQDAPILAPDDALAEAHARQACIVVAVGDRGARAVVQARLARAGLVEGVDFVCAA